MLLLGRIGVGVAFIGATVAVSHAQPVEWRTQDGGNEHWYMAFHSSHAWLWEDARRMATAAGGYLVTVGSAAEQAFLRANTVGGNGYSYVTGLYQDVNDPAYSEPAGGWKWSNGEALTYWPFCAGEPNASSADDNFAVAWGGSLGFCLNDCVRCNQNTALVEFSADCNGDGLVDFGQVRSGLLPDANGDLIPDWIRVEVQPRDQAVGVDSPVTFVVEAATPFGCAGGLVYQWQRRNPLVDPSSPDAWIDLEDGGGFVNTRSAALVISRPTPGLATGYRCKISGCGCEDVPRAVVVTDEVNFSVACPADFNADGGVDFQDVEAFFMRWEAGC